MGRIKEFVWVAALLIGLIAVNEIALIRWCRADTRPLAWDESIHTQLAVEYRNRIHNEGFRSVAHPAYFSYPPLYHLLLSTVLDVPRDIADAGAIINGIVLAALIVVVFLLGKTFIGPWEGLLAAFLVTCYPGIVDLTRPPMTDLLLTLWVTLGFYTLYWSDGFSRLSWSVAFGVVSGLGMLTKYSYVVYLIVPVTITAVRSVRLGSARKFFLVMGLAVLIASSWYLENFILLIALLRRATGSVPAGMGDLHGWQNVFRYAFHLIEALNLYCLILLVPGLLVSFWKPKMTGLLIWFLSGLIFFSIIRNHNVRYAAPVLPAAALLSVAWFPSERRWMLGVIAAGTAACFVFQQYSPEHKVMATLASVPVTIFGNQAPHAEDWKHKEIIQKIEETKPKSRFCRVVILSDAPFFHSTTLNLTAGIAGVTDFLFVGPSHNRWLDFKDFVLFKTGDLGPESSLGNIKPAAELVASSPAWFQKTYKEVGRWPLPDGSEAILYKADPSAVKNFGVDALQLSLKKLRIGDIDLADVDVRVVSIAAAETALGRFKELRVRASQISTKDLTFQNADLRLISPQISMPRLLETGEIQIISAEALEPSLDLKGDLVSSYAARKIKGLVDPSVLFTRAETELRARYHGVPLAVLFSYGLRSESLSLRLTSAKAGFVPLPKILFSGMTDREISFRPNDEIPFSLRISKLSGNGSTLRVGR